MDWRKAKRERKPVRVFLVWFGLVFLHVQTVGDDGLDEDCGIVEK